MLELALRRTSQAVTRHPIGDAPVTIGRASSNSIRLVDPDISRHHCRIELKGGEVRLTDLSTNGTLVNGEVRREARIQAGDRLSVGPWTIHVEEAGSDDAAKTHAARPQATRVVSFDAAKGIITTEAIELVIESPGRPPLKRRVASGVAVIGHDAKADVEVPDPYVSRQHCRLASEAGQLRLVDLSSTNGTLVNGVRVAETLLGPAGEFQIGRSKVSCRISRATERLAGSRNARLGAMIGPSKAMREVFALIERAGPSDATVCIMGESGTGKELAAREVHALSRRRRGPFIAVNCAALPASLIESQLFGHERGAFTGAAERTAGLFEQAKGGTLFLDEIGEMPLDLQARLLRAIESRAIRRVGGQEEIPTDVRIVCATNRDLKRLVAEGRFREDLFFRIFVFPIRIPTLRERAEDIPALADHFLAQMAGGRKSLAPPATKRLKEHGWPGNVRELKNLLERTAILAQGDELQASDLKIEAMGDREGGRLKEHERDILAETVEECGGNLTAAAKRLGIARTTIQKKVKRYSIGVNRDHGKPGK